MSLLNINVNGMEFTAHKCVLTIRWPVFERTFNTEMIQKKTNKVNIVDMGQHAFEQLFKYIYLGTAAIKDYVIQLYFAADMYRHVYDE